MERTIETAVVTGATGVIGVALCQRLLDEKILVYAICRPGSRRIAHLPVHENLHIIECDIKDYFLLPKILGKQCDAFFHLGWAYTYGEGRNDMQAQICNIQYTIDAVHAADTLGCKIFLGAGSQAEYGRKDAILRPDTPVSPENGYGMAKLCAGQMSRLECRKLGMAHIWARVLSVYGPCDGMYTLINGSIRRLLSGESPALTAGEQMWDYIYAADAADAFYRMARRGRDGVIYLIGSGQTRPLREYLEILRDEVGVKIPLGFGKIPYDAAQIMYLQADIQNLCRDTGFLPRISFETGIRETIKWVRSNNHG